MTSRSFLSLAVLVTLPLALVACGGDDNEAYFAARGESDASVAMAADGGTDSGTTVDASLPTFALGGTVSGLTPGSTLVLSDGAGDMLTIFADGTFRFPAVPTGTAYVVSVSTQPSNPPETCTVAKGSGTIGSLAVSNVEITCAVPSFTIGGTISGLAGTGLVLEDNLGDDLAVGAASGADAGSVAFTFATPVATGGAYSVTVKTQPSAPAQLCAVTSGAGTIASANVDSVTITCESSYPVSATVSGLGTGETLVLQDNGGDDLTVTADGTQAFGTLVKSGSAYAVTVLTQPSTPAKQCIVSSGSGVATANVSVAVSCTLAYYVDVTKGLDTNAGTPAAPWKTITHAIATVPAAGGAIVVEPGTYSPASGEVFPLEPRSNQSLIGVVIGAGAQQQGVILTGAPGSYTFAGGARQGQSDGFLVVFTKGVTGASLSGFSMSTVFDAPLVAFDGATATLASSTIVGTVYIAIEVADGASATLSGNTVTAGTVSLDVFDPSTVIKARGNTFTGSHAIAVLLDASTATIPASSVDFGTHTDPGDNTFITASSSLGFSATANDVGALVSGNTWSANVQGADADGHYLPATTPVTGPVAAVAGNNYALSATATLQF